tara:strand:+ start:353 stop:625 length:273 start_codon:yes stop_codon:yes gene_type:complete
LELSKVSQANQIVSNLIQDTPYRQSVQVSKLHVHPELTNHYLERKVVSLLVQIISLNPLGLPNKHVALQENLNLKKGNLPVFAMKIVNYQ